MSTTLQVRGHLQRCLGCPVPFEEIGGLTIGKMKAMEAALGTGSPNKPAPAAEKAATPTPSTPATKNPAVAGPTPPAAVTSTKKRTPSLESVTSSSPDSPGTPAQLPKVRVGCGGTRERSIHCIFSTRLIKPADARFHFPKSLLKQCDIHLKGQERSAELPASCILQDL